MFDQWSLRSMYTCEYNVFHYFFYFCILNSENGHVLFIKCPIKCSLNVWQNRDMKIPNSYIFRFSKFKYFSSMLSKNIWKLGKLSPIHNNTQLSIERNKKSQSNQIYCILNQNMFSHIGNRLMYFITHYGLTAHTLIFFQCIFIFILPFFTWYVLYVFFAFHRIQTNVGKYMNSDTCASSDCFKKVKDNNNLHELFAPGELFVFHVESILFQYLRILFSLEFF